MIELRDEEVFYAFAPDMEPALTVAQGTEFTLITKDCFANQLKTNDDMLDDLDWDQINPATGPVYIEGVKPGDLVRIDIRSIELTSKSVMTTIPGSGAISDIVEASTYVLDNHDSVLSLPTAKGLLKLPLQPMIGVIGLAPNSQAVPTGTPGEHGGNMDCKLIGQGTSLYLRAAQEGGLFGCGDVHALMGDGEVLVCGAETAARLTFAISVVAGIDLPVPFLATPDSYVTIASALTTDEAYQEAVDMMSRFLTQTAGLPINDSGRLMSLVGNLAFCQVVDPMVTIRFEFPKNILRELGFVDM
ncbi:MAG: acetamidase/formamidase family protein [Coriobacteriia bacterium]|nr:acetamidase/formamidase family protein [Coriobacteriia bacterium]